MAYITQEILPIILMYKNFLDILSAFQCLTITQTKGILYIKLNKLPIIPIIITLSIAY